MNNLLRLLLLLSFITFWYIVAVAYGKMPSEFGHIGLSIPFIMFLIFSQAFIMFYFIGISRLVENVLNVLNSKQQLETLFDEPFPKDLTPYRKDVNRLHYQTSLCKRQTIPWTALILILGIVAFLFGGAFHTGQVSRMVHVGLILGFAIAFSFGFYKQWTYLGRANKYLRELKNLFNLSHDTM